MVAVRTPECVEVDYDPIGLSHLHYVFTKPNNVYHVIVPRKDDREIKLDLYLPPKIKGKNKTIILYPGCTVQGYEMTNIAEGFVNKGYYVWVVDFSVGEVESHTFCHFTISQLIKDVKDVINFVYSQAFIDKDNLFIAGHSFGALSSLLYLARHKEKRIKAVISICPVVDVVEIGLNHFRQIAHKAHYIERILKLWIWKARRFLRNFVFFGWKLFGKFLFIIKNGKKVFLGREFLEDILKHNQKEKVIKEISTISIPLLILHAENDPWVRIENIIELYGKLCSKFKEFFLLRNVGHLPLGEAGASQIIEKAVPWLEDICASTFPQKAPAIFSNS